VVSLPLSDCVVEVTDQKAARDVSTRVLGPKVRADADP
jgi:hypothetical protein